jgi:Rrf2 family nitric oxide-sensitive transcriptional repressor
MPMRLTTFTDFTLRTLIYLAVRPSRLVTIAEIATAYGIPDTHLNKVVNQLALAGDVRTVRGRHGGLKLAREMEQINIGAVLRRTEAGLALTGCFDCQNCTIQDHCVLKGALGEALAAFTNVVDSYTLADLVENRATLSRLLGIPADDGAAAVNRGGFAAASVPVGLLQ